MRRVPVAAGIDLSENLWVDMGGYINICQGVELSEDGSVEYIHWDEDLDEMTERWKGMARI